jgi:hypothetical protein
MNKEAIWYIGFIVGAAGANLVLQVHFGALHGLLRLLIILAAGVGCGWLADSFLRPADS